MSRDDNDQRTTFQQVIASLTWITGLMFGIPAAIATENLLVGILVTAVVIYLLKNVIRAIKNFSFQILFSLLLIGIVVLVVAASMK